MAHVGIARADDLGDTPGLEDEDGPVEVTSGLPEPVALVPTKGDEPPARPDKPAEPAPASDRPRTEIAALPIVAGNSDIGVQFGGAGFITRLAPGERPYAWKADLLLSMSLKPGPEGVDLAQQSHDLRLDIPRFMESRVRVMPGLFFERHINAGYYGIGNATPAIANPDGSFGRRYQSITEELRARLNVRFPLYGKLDGMVGLALRYTDATAYPGSKLEEDAAATEPNGKPRIRGMDPVFSAMPAVGVVYDTRDNEVSPRSGVFHIVGVRASGGLPTSSDVAYVGGSVVLRGYVPLPGSFVLAGRFVGDVIGGHAPFYDMIQGVTFTPIDLIGGHGGLRGVPNGRYTGKVKTLASLELRTLLVTFGALRQRFRVGAQVFGDVGRIWSDLRPEVSKDGRGLGLKWGAGGGLYAIWGEAAIIRVELAYSPDVHSANPGLPVGVYVADGHAF